MTKLKDKLGFNLFYWDRHFSEALDLMQQKGVKYARLYWDFQSYEIKDDALAWHWRDDAIKQVVDRGMIPVLPFSAGEITGERTWVDETRSYFTVDEIAKFKKFITQVVERYKQYNIIYEAWNEATGSFWVWSWHDAQNDPTVIRSYMNMNRYIAQQVKKIAPDSWFCDLSSVYYPNVHEPFGSNKLAKVIEELKKDVKQTDYISFHPYPLQSINNGMPETLIRDGKIDDLDIPLMYTELGYPLEKSWQGEWNVAQSADKLVRLLLISDAIGIDAMIPYTLRTGQDYSLANSRNKQLELNYIGQAVFDLLDELGDHTFVRQIDTGSHVDFSDDLYVLEYRKGAQLKIAYWTPKETIRQQITWQDYRPELVFETKVKFLNYSDLAKQ